MKLEKAIEILISNKDSITEQDDIDFEDAQKLGLEAMKRIKAIRPYSNSDKSYYLKGETKE